MKGQEGRTPMSTTTENTSIYFEAISGWMATHQGMMPGAEPTSGEPVRNTVVDTPYMDDVALNGIAPWGDHHRVTKPKTETALGPA